MFYRSKNILSTAILFILLLLPNIYAVCVASDLASPAKAGAYMFVAIAGLFIPMLFLRARTYFIIMGILFLFCSPIEIASLYLNHNPATATFVGLFYATNWREITGVVGAVWPLLLLLIGIWTLYFVFAARQPQEWLLPKHIVLWCLGLGMPLMVASAMFVFGRYARIIYNLQDPREIISLAKDLTLMKFYKIYPYNFYINTYKIFSERAETRRAQAELAPFHFGITPYEDHCQELYILVIGEAARSENFAINGYERPTTPRLAKRQNIVSYSHMYSQAGTTEQSVPHMISRIPATRHNRVYSEKTLPEAFQEAGYKASWLTNKSRAFYMERVLTAMDCRYETGKDMSTINNYDEYLLTPIHQVVNDTIQKQFIVVHTMGSHWRYDTRYPASFELFTPAIGEDFQLSMINPSNRELLLNAYDNTILYTDYFLDSLISIVEQTHLPAVIMYMSDHGENLYDDERELVLHGNYSTSRWLFHVPFIVWYSDEYALHNPEKIVSLRAHVNTYDNSSVIFSSMLDAASIAHWSCDSLESIYPISRSVFSDQYKAPDTIYVLTAEGNSIVLNE